MTTELKGRYAVYYTGNSATRIVEKATRLSLNAVKTNFGADIARLVLAKKRFIFGDTHWFELELLPGEKTAEDTHREQLCGALYQDLRQSYPSLTFASVQSDVEKLLAGEQPTSVIQMFAQPYLLELGLIKQEGK